MSIETTKPQDLPCRIVKLEVQNVQRVKAVCIVPVNPTVTLQGDNNQGKSSVLLGIFMTIQGGKAIPDKPIRDGTNRAESTVDFGEFVANLKISQSTGAKLTVRSKSGINIPGPATFLKESSNEILMDPVGFIRLGETPEGRKKQSTMLRGLVGLDFTALDSQRNQAYLDRTLVNRDLEAAQKRLGSFQLNPDAPDEQVSVAKLLEQQSAIRETAAAVIRGAEHHNAENEKVKKHWEDVANLRTEKLAARDAKQAEMHGIVEQIKALEKQLEDRTSELATIGDDVTRIEANLKEGESQIADLRYEDLEAIQAEHKERERPINLQIAQADVTNQMVRTNARHREIAEEIKKHQARSNDLTALIEQADRSKQEQMAAAKFPLPGLTFNEDGLALNGFPFDQVSTAKQLIAAVAIGLSLKPKIRVALLKEASFLDDNSLKELNDLLVAQEAQAWCEVVHSKDPQAIHIEDGEVKE